MKISANQSKLDSALKSISLVNTIIKKGREAEEWLKNIDPELIKELTEETPVPMEISTPVPVFTDTGTDTDTDDDYEDNQISKLIKSKRKICNEYINIVKQYLKEDPERIYRLTDNETKFRVKNIHKDMFARRIIDRYNKLDKAKNTSYPDTIIKRKSWFNKFAKIYKCVLGTTIYQFKNEKEIR